jgi:cell division protein FtsL
MKFIRSKTNNHIPVQTKKDYKKLYLILIVLVFMLKIFVTIHRSATGAEIVDIERNEAELVNTNQELKKQLVNKTSLTHLEKIAEESKFIKPSEIVYLKTESAFAIAR